MAPDRGAPALLGPRGGQALDGRVRLILTRHREGVDGWCLGCADEGVLRFHPCPVGSWAASVGCAPEAGSYHGGTAGAWRPA